MLPEGGRYNFKPMQRYSLDVSASFNLTFCSSGIKFWLGDFFHEVFNLKKLKLILLQVRL